MRIRRVKVDSFGDLRNQYLEFGDSNLTVIYGDNEAGKTTFSEFIRGTIFNGRNAKYPIQKKTDMGYVEVEMADGSVKTVIRDGRRVYEQNSRTLPSDDLKMDSDTYRSLFSFDIEQISDDRMISNGEFRRKFLTVPGGEHVPEVSESIKESMAVLSTREKLTDTRELGRLRKKCRDADERIAQCNERTESYNELIIRKEKLGRDLDNARLLKDKEAFEKNKAFMFESLKENTQKLEDLRARRKEISFAEELTDEDIRQYDELRARLVTLDGLIESGATDENEDDEMTAQEVRHIMSMSAEIEDVWSSRSRMEILDGAIADLKASVDRDSKKINDIMLETGLMSDDLEQIVNDPEVRYMLRNPDNRKAVNQRTVNWFTKRKRAIYSALGIVGSGVAYYFGYGWAALPLLTLVFIVNTIPTLISGYCRVDNVDWPDWLEKKHFRGMTELNQALDAYDVIEPNSYVIERYFLSKKRYDAFTLEMNSLLEHARTVTTKLKIGTGNQFRDINEMHRLYVKAKEMSEAFSESDGLAEKRASVAKELDALVARFGSESEFVDTRIARDELKSLDIRIKELEDALQSAQELSTDVIKKTIDETLDTNGEPVDPSKLIEDINFQIGEVTTEMRHIVNDDELSECLVAKGTAEKEFNTALRQWAVYAIADHIIAECCKKFYEKMQPAVVKTANRYLYLMTNGRYRLGSDPRDSSLFIEDIRKDSKHVGEWSSGLSDQVYLSVKMAIAKEMGTERLPLVIDDILIRFDSRRKQGACRALMEFAEDQQVIMFTCDSSLYSMFKLEGKINYIELH
ncbi:MAG: AAA family ATPase [Candidatus Methanomethylophilaceae archaeon]|nr:AAA family ATPase [Candidatus Methanomethylophilaceae archaeon]